MIRVNRAGTWQAAGQYGIPVFNDPDGFVLGSTEPIWGNSGCLTPESELGRFPGTELVTDRDGQVIENLILDRARIKVIHNGVRIRNCVIRYGSPVGRQLIHAHCGVVVTSNVTNLVLEHVTLDPVNAKAPGDVMTII